MNVLTTYKKINKWYTRTRDQSLFEKKWLDKAIEYLQPKATVLDLGCGTGNPIANYFVNKQFQLTGIDGCEEFIVIAQKEIPGGNFLVQDMRMLTLSNKFDLIIAWNSFFHLNMDDQRNYFAIFKTYLNKGGILLFTSGPHAGELWSNNGGEDLYHASLSPEEYQSLLIKNGFEIIEFKMNDVMCNYHTVWLTKYV